MSKLRCLFYNIVLPVKNFFRKRRIEKIFSKYERVYADDGYPSCSFEVGEVVFDDLTCKLCIIRRISESKNAIGYWLNSNYLGGGRHPWELTKVKKKNE